MANNWYGKGVEAFANGEIDWIDHDIKAVLVDTSLYTVNIDVDDFLADIAVGARIDTSGNLTGKTNVLGVLDAADTTFDNVPAGATVEACVIYKDTGNPATSPLLLYIDTATGLVLTPSGSDVIAQWHASGIAVL